MIHGKLTNEDITNCVDEAEQFFSAARVEKKDSLRLLLLLEDILLTYQEKMGQESSFACRTVRQLGKLRLELRIPGNSLDPFSGEEEDQMLHGILAGLGVAPVWQYKNGENILIFVPRKKKLPQYLSLLLAVGLGIICGLLCRLMPAMGNFLAQNIVTPVFDTFVGFLTAVSGPLIFLSVTWGIYSIGDTSTLGRIGKKMMKRYLVISILVGVIFLMILLPFFPVSQGAGGGSIQFDQIVSLVLDMIPHNMITPFTEGNPLQIIVLAAIMGTAILVLGSKASLAASLVEQSSYVVQLIMEAVSSLIPFFVFGSVFNMVMSGNLGTLSSAGKILPLMVLGDFLVIGCYMLTVCLRRKVSFRTLFQKLFPTFLIGLSTASSAAAFSTNVECCEKKLGIDQRIVNFGVPLGQVVFMPSAIIMYLSVSLSMAEAWGVSMTPPWLMTAAFIAVVLAIATPPVPGGGLTCYTMLFLQLQIPGEAIGVTIALNMILEFIATATNLACQQMELTELSAELHMLDTECLRRKNQTAVRE